MITRLKSLLTSSPARFALVGGVSTVIDIGILNLGLWLGLNLYLATAIGFLSGTINGYLMNSRHVFRTEHNHRHFTKYTLVSFVGFWLTELIVFLMHEGAGWTPMPAKLMAVVIVFFWSYSASRLWAFK